MALLEGVDPALWHGGKDLFPPLLPVLLPPLPIPLKHPMKSAGGSVVPLRLPEGGLSTSPPYLTEDMRALTG